MAKEYNIYLDCVLHKIFKDIPDINYIKHKDKTYRTQEKQKSLDEVEYAELPKSIYKYINPHYTGNDLIEGSITSYFYKIFNVPFSTPLDWSLPDFSNELAEFNLDIPSDRKIAIIRPATIRKEWPNYTRNPNPFYISWCCKVLNEAGYYTISIADLAVGEEWLLDGVDNSAKLKLHKGELGIYATLGLMQKSHIVLGGSGFIIPASVSMNTNLFVIFGGRGAFDSVYKVFHPSMNMKQISWAAPQSQCRCSESVHDCDKSIPHLESDFYKFLKEVQ